MDVGGWQFGATGLQRPRKKARADAAGGEALGGAVVVLTEGAKTAALTLEGQLWVWGYNFCQLGLADTDCRRAPMLVGAEAALGDLDVLTVVCGYFHTLIVKKDGGLCTFGTGEHVALGHKAVANAHRGAAL